MELEQEAGTNSRYISSIPAKLSFLAGSGKYSHIIRKLGSHLASPLHPSPTIPSPTEWAVKNTMFTAQQLLLAATAFGLETSPMEGFDERRLMSQFNIPEDRYTIPLVVAIGNKPEDVDQNPLSETEACLGFQEKARYSLDSICFEDGYNNRAVFD
jgi:nitroreductase